MQGSEFNFTDPAELALVNVASGDPDCGLYISETDNSLDHGAAGTDYVLARSKDSDNNLAPAAAPVTSRYLSPLPSSLTFL